MDHIDFISSVYPGRKRFTRGGEQEHCFNVVRGRFTEIMRYDSKDRAVRERAALIKLVGHDEVDTDEMERTLDGIMDNHVAAAIDKQDDGTWLVTADQSVEYVIFTDGTRTPGRELA